MQADDESQFPSKLITPKRVALVDYDSISTFVIIVCHRHFRFCCCASNQAPIASGGASDVRAGNFHVISI